MSRDYPASAPSAEEDGEKMFITRAGARELNEAAHELKELKELKKLKDLKELKELKELKDIGKSAATELRLASEEWAYTGGSQACCAQACWPNGSTCSTLKP